MTFFENEHVQRFLQRLEGTKGEGTADTWRSDIRQFSNWYDGSDPRNVDWVDVEDYLLHLNDEGYQGATIQSRYTALSALYDFLTAKIEVIDEDENPVEKVDYGEYTVISNSTMKEQYTDAGDEGIVYITDDEKEALCENVPAPQVRNELIVRLMWETGVREHELRSIELDDVDRDERTIQINDEKTDDKRTVAYQPSLNLLLDQWVGKYRNAYTVSEESDYLFLTRKSPQMSEGSASDMIKKAAHEAGIQEPLGEDAAGKTRWRVTAHTLRHSHGVQAVKSGIQLPMLQEHLGHEDISTTQVYLEVTSDDATEAFHQRFDEGG
ncbi:MAG: tyrosine-type recombinase/integrase [Halobacteriaceae archaeon]